MQKTKTKTQKRNVGHNGGRRSIYGKPLQRKMVRLNDDQIELIKSVNPDNFNGGLLAILDDMSVKIAIMNLADIQKIERRKA